MKRSLALVLTVIMLLSMASCNLFQSSDSKETTTESNTPKVEPDVTTPEPDVTTPEPGDTTPEPGDTTPEPGDTTPEPGDTTPDLEVTLPKASELLANIIGTLAATLEITKDSELVYVTEWKNSEDSEGYKQVLFVEIAEAAVNSNSEDLQAHLKVKFGLAEATLTGLVPSEDVVVDKENAEYCELSVSVNGDDVSFSVNDQSDSANLSEIFYGAIARLVGVGDIEGLQGMLESAYLMQELENKLMPLIEKAFGAVAEGLPTVSPAYSEHLEELFALLGEEILTVTTDGTTGNKTYSLNPVAFKKLLADIEDKTVAEYLESVYGEDVVGTLASFLKSVPDKTVKEIVDATVAFAEGTGVAIKDIYAMIDLYVYSVTGEEISIEEQINERYNKTLAELLVELNGIPAEEQADFIASMKKSFAQAAQTIETVSVETLLSTMFIGTNEGFFDEIEATIDMLDEQIKLNFTTDAAGNVIAMNYAVGDLQYSLLVNGNDATLSVTMPNDVVITVTANDDGFNFVVKENDEQISSGSVTVTEETIDEDVITTLVATLRDDKNELLTYKVVSVNGVTTTLDVVLGGYEVTNEVTFNSETGEYFETRTETFVEFITVEYDDLGTEGQVLNISSNDTLIVITKKDDQLTMVVTESGEQVASGSITKTEVTEGEDVISTLIATLRDDENELLTYKVVSVNGVVTELDAAVKGYFREETWVENSDNGEDFFDGEEREDFVFGDSDGFLNGDLVYGDPVYGDVTFAPISKGELVVTETYVTWLTVEYDDLGVEGSILKICAHDSVISVADYITITANNNQITAVLYKDEELVANTTLSFDETGLSVEINDASEQIFQAGFEIIDNPEGEDFIRVEYQGTVVAIGYKADESGMKIAIYDETLETVLALLEVIESGESVTVKALLDMFCEEILDSVVTFTISTDGDAQVLIIDIDLDRFLICDDAWSTDYIEFNGVIKLKIA